MTRWLQESADATALPELPVLDGRHSIVCLAITARTGKQTLWCFSEETVFVVDRMKCNEPPTTRQDRQLSAGSSPECATEIHRVRTSHRSRVIRWR